MSTYRIGTVTVSNGSTSVTGSGTAWVSAGIRAGDFLFVNGLFGEIASVESNTALTLVRGWPGSNGSGQQYSIALIDDGQRSIASLNQVLQSLGTGTLTSLAGLSAVANEMPYWTGAGVMGKTALTSAARAILGLAGASGAKIPVVTGAGAAALRDIVGTVSQSGGVPTGAIIQRGSNSNGEFVRFADGTQICAHTLAGALVISTAAGAIFQSDEITWTYPAAFATVGTTTITASMRTAASSVLNGRPISGSQANIRGLAPSSIGSAQSVNVVAIGRWF